MNQKISLTLSLFLVGTLLGDGSKSQLTVLDDINADTTGSWKSDGWLVLAEDEDVLDTGDELAAGLVDESDHVVGAVVLVDGLDLADAAGVVTAGDLGDGVGLELVDVLNLAGLEVVLDGVTDLDLWVEETDVVAIVAGAVEDPLVALDDVVDSEELVVALFALDWGEVEAALGIIHHSEVHVALRDRDDVHETGWIAFVDSDLAVDEDVLVADDHAGLTHVTGEVESVTDDEGQRQALNQLVWAGRWSRSEDTVHLVNHPLVRRVQGFHMKTWTTSLWC